ncbi:MULTISPECIES: hypothetical protein [unclassified Burkholderia]|uniref:hypothetical protein n=1 Tax=unclassified Burkholderia TaxID=2613784 RepID=UPI00158BB1E5|nr:MULTISPECIES: hypothetical protein [unclassified Burkholderia]
MSDGATARTDELIALLSRTPCDVLITDYVMAGGPFVDKLSLLQSVCCAHGPA